MSGSRDPMDYRAGDTDRERVAEVLREAAGDGRISLDELDVRLSAVYTASTYKELADLIADLPPAAQVPALRDDSEPLVLAGAGGSVHRKGRWQVPSKVVVDRKLGSVVLDFRSAVFDAPVTSVEVKMAHGSLTLILPDQATASVDVVTNYGSVHSSVPAIPIPGRPHLAVTGVKAFGSLRVRYGYGHRWRARAR